MPRTSAHGPLTVLAALGDEPASTSALYDRVGYPVLVQIGLIPYARFRAALGELEREGLAARTEDEEGTTLWQRTERGAAVAGQRTR